MRDRRHPSYLAPPLRDLFAQRIYHLASGYADGKDANRLRHDPLLPRRVERGPLDPTQDLASAPTLSRLEPSVTRTDLYRLPPAFVDHCITSYPEPPAAIVLDRDHSEDPTHGQQGLTCYNHHSQRHCYLPLFIFAGTSHAWVTACLRPGTRPPGVEHARLLVRLLAYLRRHWPSTHILVRGDSHCATPEVLAVIAPRRRTDFVCGLAGNPGLRRHAAPVMQEARGLFQQRTAWAHAYGAPPPPSRRVYEVFALPSRLPLLLLRESARRSRALAISPEDSVWHRARPLQGRGAPGCRNAAACQAPKRRSSGSHHANIPLRWLAQT